MFSHSFNNRFNQDVLQNNILMTQIRAEKKIYSSKNTQTCNSHRDGLQSNRFGKRVFQDIVNRPSLSPSAKENTSFNWGNFHKGRKIMMETVRVEPERSRSGKKRFDTSANK